MRACDCGEALTRSVHENAANRTAAMRARPQVCERPELLIGLRACDNRRIHASNFLADRSFHTVQKRCEGASHSKALRAKCIRNAGSVLRKLGECARVPASLLWSSFGLAGRCDSSLERDAMTGSGRFRGYACADLFRPFGVLVVWVLI